MRNLQHLSKNLSMKTMEQVHSNAGPSMVPDVENLKGKQL